MRYFKPNYYHIIFSAFFLIVSENLHSNTFCEPLVSQYGNNDYLDTNNKRDLKLVEDFHFNEKVRQLQGGARPSGSLVGDLEYTLNWFPNHHMALDTLVRLAIREKNPTPLGAKKNIECRFVYAKNVNPEDGMVPFIEARYRYETGDFDKARKLLHLAANLASNDANVLYNVGLLYFRMNDYESAVKNARSAYKLGFPLPGLRDMLKEAGHPIN